MKTGHSIYLQADASLLCNESCSRRFWSYRFGMDSHTLLICGTLAAIAIGIFILWGPSPHRRRRPGYIVGLVNLGNTCFINTVLQAMASCPLLVEWLSTQTRREGSLIEAICYTLSVLNGQEPLEGDYFTSACVLRALNGHGWMISADEQDAHELFHIVMTSLEDEVKAASSKVVSLSEALAQPFDERLFKFRTRGSGDVSMTSEMPLLPRPIRAGDISARLALKENIQPWLPFQGLVTSQLTCTVCQHKTPILYDKFDSLSLSLPSLECLPARQLTLTHLLASYVATETVKGVECDGCKQAQDSSSPVKSTAVKSVAFGKLPKCLCFHILRTTWQQNGQPVKRYDHVQFPEFLSMDPYTLSRTCKRKNLEVGQNGQPGSSGDSNQQASSTDLIIKHLYRLVAIVVHTGGLQSGHFVTYRRAPFREHNWYYISDQLVEESSIDQVMKTCAYMLFYTKLDQQSLTKTPTVGL